MLGGNEILFFFFWFVNLIAIMSLDICDQIILRSNERKQHKDNGLQCLKHNCRYISGEYSGSMDFIVHTRVTPYHLPAQCVQEAAFTNMMTSSNGNIFRVTGPLCGGTHW